jgi:O-antigen/teichoic acid export membrane protein
MSVLKKLAGQTAIYGISSILGRVLNFGLTPFYTKVFQPGVYGVIGNLMSYVAFIQVFLTFGMETAFFRFTKDANKSPEAYNHAFLTVGTLSSAFLILGVAGYKVIANWIGYGDQPNLVLMVVIIIFMDVMAALPMSRLRYEEKAIRFAAINLANIFLTILLNVIFIGFMHKGVEYVFIANLIASATKLLLVLPGTLPTRLALNPSNLRAMSSYGFYIMLAGLAGMMNETLDRILIPFLWKDGQLWNGVERTGREMVGIYSANYKLAILILLVTQAFRYAAEPYFFKAAKDKDSPETFAMIFHFFMIACLAGFLILASFAHEIAAINFFGKAYLIDDRYWEGLNVVPIILLAYVCSAAYTNISIWFKITKQTRFALLFTGTGAFLTILINVITIPMIGYVGSAWATLISYSAMLVIVYVTGQKYYPIPYRVNRLMQYALLIMVAFFMNFAIGPSDGHFGTLAGKALVCLGAFGLIALYERSNPEFPQVFKKQNVEKE